LSSSSEQMWSLETGCPRWCGPPSAGLSQQYQYELEDVKQPLAPSARLPRTHASARLSFGPLDADQINRTIRFMRPLPSSAGGYRLDEDTWVATSPDVPRWTVVADSYSEAHHLAEDGVRFALERDDLTIEHYVPAGVAVAA
jgi:hypothetical protein